MDDVLREAEEAEAEGSNAGVEDDAAAEDGGDGAQPQRQEAERPAKEDFTLKYQVSGACVIRETLSLSFLGFPVLACVFPPPAKT